jgi:hypothetical protein
MKYDSKYLIENKQTEMQDYFDKDRFYDNLITMNDGFPEDRRGQ